MIVKTKCFQADNFQKGGAANPKGKGTGNVGRGGEMEMEVWIAKKPWNPKGATAGWVLTDQIHPTGRPKNLCATLTPVNLKGLHTPNCEVPSSHQTHSAPLRKSHHSGSSPVSWTSHIWCSASLPACDIIQTSQSYSPTGTSRGHLPFLLLQSLPFTAPAGSLSPECSPGVAVHGVQCPAALSCEDM